MYLELKSRRIWTGVSAGVIDDSLALADVQDLI